MAVGHRSSPQIVGLPQGVWQDADWQRLDDGIPEGMLRAADISQHGGRASFGQRTKPSRDYLARLPRKAEEIRPPVLHDESLSHGGKRRGVGSGLVETYQTESFLCLAMEGQPLREGRSQSQRGLCKDGLQGGLQVGRRDGTTGAQDRGREQQGRILRPWIPQSHPGPLLTGHRVAHGEGGRLKRQRQCGRCFGRGEQRVDDLPEIPRRLHIQSFHRPAGEKSRMAVDQQLRQVQTE